MYPLRRDFPQHQSARAAPVHKARDIGACGWRFRQQHCPDHIQNRLAGHGEEPGHPPDPKDSQQPEDPNPVRRIQRAREVKSRPEHRREEERRAVHRRWQ